ncbi:MAG: MBL fold metallo-hydrolase, partial [Patescibacteria group bacterium]|nr:MBL fold metallo-hydrolase [Patescibacteria group bacterium]
MKIKFLGAAGTVTGSSYVLTSDSGQSILIDLGMFQGTEEIEKLNYLRYDYDCSKLSGIILTHAHLDHCGRLPIAIKNGFRGKIWLTAPTYDLTALSLLDTAKIAIKDDKPILFNEKQVFKTISRFAIVNYHQKFKIGNFEITFFDAGHLLGSASVLVEDIRSNSKIKKVVFSGDLGNSPDSLLMPLEFIKDADVVVMESTYGDKLHPKSDPSEELEREIIEIVKTGGTLLIPAFALDRTQKVLHLIKHLKAEGKVPYELPVYLDGPMAQKAIDIYLKYFDFFNYNFQSELSKENPFYFPGLKVVMRYEESIAIRTSQETKIIIAGSGMMNGGRIVAHAAAFLGDSKNRIFLVGYQGEETLGREILDGASQVTIDEETIFIKAHVSHTESMSSHADQGQLIDWLSNIRGVSKVILTHGEDEQRKVLANKIRETLNVSDISLPQLNEEI